MLLCSKTVKCHPVNGGGNRDITSKHHRETVSRGGTLCCQPRHSPLLRPRAPQALSRSDLCLHEDQDEDQEGRDGGCHHHPGRERAGTAQGWDEPCTLIGGGHREPRGHCQLLHGQKEDGTQGHSMLGTQAAAAPMKVYVPSTREPGNLGVNGFGGN